MIIKIRDFKGMAPGISATELPPNAAQTAENCDLKSGSIRPWKDYSEVYNPYKAGAIRSLFYYLGAYWFHWLYDVDCVNSTISDDDYDRAYFCGEGSAVPQMTTSAIAVGTNLPAASYDLGIPQPASSPTVTQIPGGGTPGEATEWEDRYYVYTYVSAYGEEGPPSAPSAMITVDPVRGDTVSVGMLTGPSGNYNIVYKKVYRTNTGTSGTDYQHVATVAVATTPYVDDVDSASLGAVIDCTEYYAPPTTLKGLVVMPYGGLAGFSGQDVCFTPAYLPHAWPPSYRITVDYPVVALGVFGSSLLVTTEGFPYIITGSTPGSMSKEKLEIGQSCVSKAGLVDMGYAIIYPAPDGLVMVSTNGGVELITAKIMDRTTWQAYTPSSITASHFDGKYVAFYDTGVVTGGFIFNPLTLDFTELSFYASCGYSHAETGDLYLAINYGGGDHHIYRWNAGVASLTSTWKSKKFITTQPTNFGAAQVFADSYPLTFKTYVDGSAVASHTQTVADSTPFRLPAGFLGSVWEVEVSGTSNVNSILLANTIYELAKSTS